MHSARYDLNIEFFCFLMLKTLSIRALSLSEEAVLQILGFSVAMQQLAYSRAFRGDDQESKALALRQPSPPLPLPDPPNPLNPLSTHHPPTDLEVSGGWAPSSASIPTDLECLWRPG